jgi:hypothetical protein
MDSQKSDACGPNGLEGRNLKTICSLVTDNGQGPYVDIIDSILSTEYPYVSRNILSADKDNTLVFVLQLTLTAISLHPNMCIKRVCHFDLSQIQTYSTADRQPVFTGKYKQNINALWLLYTVNFFKFHLKSDGEGIMAHAYANMEDHQYPSMWTGRIKAGTQPLQGYWKGAHSKNCFPPSSLSYILIQTQLFLVYGISSF